MVSRRISVLALLVVSVALTPSEVACAQKSSLPVNKDRAVQEVHVRSSPGWLEAVSDDGRFRILFPGKPTVGGDVVSLKGFKLVEPERKWVAYYTDFEQPMPNDEAYLRNAYHRSVEAITKDGKRLLAQRDVLLNTRLGSEFVIDGPNLVSYMRAFVAGRRMYTLSVDQKKADGAGTVIPADVQQFFDSFTYWD